MDTNRLAYELTAQESTRWQQGGLAARQLQQQMAEVHRQGSLGLAPYLDVWHPDGILAAQHAALMPPPAQAPTVAATPTRQAEAAQDVPRATEPSASVARAQLDGRLVEATTVTAYQMSPTESAAWAQGAHDTRQVSAKIGAGLQDAVPGRAVPILMSDGRWAYTHGSNAVQILAEELRHVHPLQAFSAKMGRLREQLGDLSSGVRLDVSVQVGAPASSLQASMKTLEEKVDALVSWRDSLDANGHTHGAASATPIERLQVQMAQVAAAGANREPARQNGHGLGM